MIIAIDGPSGVGKSSVSKRLAEVIKVAYFDSGAMYRAFALAILQEKVSLEDEKGVQAVLDRSEFIIEGDIIDKDLG